MMQSASLFQQAMGDEFCKLDAALQRFHGLQGEHELQGRVQTGAPRTLAAKLLALALGTPRAASEGTIHFELQASPDAETWIRIFPSQRMHSTMQLHNGHLIERLGLARLCFALQAVDGRLLMRLQRLYFLGFPCPGWLAPRIVAEETGAGEQMQFHVEAAVPLIGVVASYRGYLLLPEEKA
ncbi:MULTISPECIES: DUF4166 domain-containing protein [Comamonas]|uniref:DUF4166 domain-containing protein n=1 Tax=Comamonas TaxID=283 RepID=UPI00050FDF52|nr:MULTISPECIES: DUF4166 domain-containing protein [Comamonas]KGG93626.1 hypothetical protein P369_08015 [Comamonas thiooxydans]KGG98870.1 hypothetical protein P367_10990 [Comamonas thiooxydans]KGH05194.1 hypothetical protein P365_11070 [Comamonas thiooxydans]KGH14324.1 hypothetical protein P368_06630 [Comamonas thiooxydans]TZG06998.1 DUF4166 domain-containing protein [Comamonas thiooxydans]